MRITTLPVFSRLADPADVAAEPELAAGLAEVEARTGRPFQLSAHQLETYRALRSPDIDVVINTAMTGDGKSLAAYLPTLLDPDRGALGMYPTNELAHDQRRQFDSYNRLFAGQLTVTSLTGETLGAFIEERPDFTRRAEALSALMHDHQVLLTNPDIFHLMINYRYGSNILSIQELPALVNACYKNYIFDEFHTFSTPQLVAAVTAMLFLSATARPHPRSRPRFLFSSATPNPVFATLLRNSGLRVAEIVGAYRTAPDPDYRPVLHGAELHLHTLGEQQNVEQWIEAHLALIEAHWQEASGPRPRGVVIVNSVVEARRIARLLSARLPALTIGENTGLTDSDCRKAAMAAADLIVGTSTIDVGVDFNISLLIFETPDAGAFLQRFGRLGRVRRNEQPFARYEAHALFSGKTPWVYDALVRELAARQIVAGAAVERPITLRDAVQAAFPASTDFRRYIKRWGALQAAHLIVGMEHPRLSGSHAAAASTLREQYQHTLELKRIDSAIGRYKRLLNAQNEPASPQGKALLDEVLSFRGSSPFQAAVWDASTSPPTFLSYDALVIAQSSDLMLAEPEPFQQALAARYPDEAERRAVLARFRYGLAHGDDPVVLYVETFLPERERLILQIDRFDPRLQLNEALLLTGISIRQPHTEQVKRLNAVLRKQRVVGYVTRKEPKELRRMLKLPSFFPLYRLYDSHDQLYTLALGQAALLLEAEALWLKHKDEETAPIIC
jgi:CRISPR-associated endonuclease/helicase Cas3